MQNIQTQFNYRHFASLNRTNPELAQKYREECLAHHNNKMKKREEMEEFIKKHGAKHWIRVFRNYKDETVLEKYEDLKKILEEEKVENGDKSGDSSGSV